MFNSKSNDTKILEAVLAETKPGEICTYEKLSKAVGRDVREHCLGNLNTARKTLENEQSIFFACERNEGYLRLDSTQKVSRAGDGRKALNRRAKRIVNCLSSVDFAELSDSDKLKHVAESAAASVALMVTKTTSVTKIEKRVTDTSKPLAIGETLKMFGGKAEDEK